MGLTLEDPEELVVGRGTQVVSTVLVSVRERTK